MLGIRRATSLEKGSKQRVPKSKKKRAQATAFVRSLSLPALGINPLVAAGHQKGYSTSDHFHHAR
jgi:hypothetical protein